MRAKRPLPIFRDGHHTVRAVARAASKDEVESGAVVGVHIDCGPRDYDIDAVFREWEQLEAMDAATAKAVACRHPSAFSLWADDGDVA